MSLIQDILICQSSLQNHKTFGSHVKILQKCERALKNYIMGSPEAALSQGDLVQRALDSRESL